MRVPKYTAATMVGAVLLSSNASAEQVIEVLREQSRQGVELGLNREQIAKLGIGEITLTDGNGRERLIEPNETVKVKAHEESGLIHFTSFDGYSRSVNLEEAAIPRNIGHGETPN